MWQPGKSLDLIEKEAIQQAFKFHQGNKTQTAASLGISIRTLDSKLEKYQTEDAERVKRLEDARAKEREWEQRARGNYNAINAAANNPVARSEEEARSKQDGYVAKERVHVEPTEETTSQHALPLSKREEVQSLSSKHASSSNTRRAR